MNTLAFTLSFVFGLSIGLFWAWSRGRQLLSVAELKGVQTQEQLNAQSQEFTLREEDLKAASEEVIELKVSNSALEAELKAYQGESKEWKNRLHGMVSEVFEKNSKQLSNLTDEKLKRVDVTLKPFNKVLGELGKKVDSLEKDRAISATELKDYIANLGKQHEGLTKATTSLRDVLRGPGSRGKLGEIHLERVLEVSGMTQYTDFLTQDPVTPLGQDKVLIPDAVIKLPVGQQLVVDSKAPLDAMLKAEECENEKERKAQWEKGVKDLKRHVRALAGKEYQASFEGTADFTVMFLPFPGTLEVAMAVDKDFFDYALEMKVVPVSPLTLVPLLKTVKFGWQRVELHERADEFETLAKQFANGVCTMVGHVADTGKGLKKAVESYNNTVGSFERTVNPAVRKLKGLEDTMKALEKEPKEISEDLRSFKQEKIDQVASYALKESAEQNAIPAQITVDSEAAPWDEIRVVPTLELSPRALVDEQTEEEDC